MDTGATHREPSWIFAGHARSPASSEQATSFLASLSDTDRDLFVLAHGLGLDLGTVAYAMRMDSSIVSWRLRRALMASEITGEPGELEHGVAALLAGNGAGEWSATARLKNMPAFVQERLAARLDSHATGNSGGEVRSGLGIGAVALTLLGMIIFMVYGVIRDEDPMWRGKARMRQGQYATARDAFRERGNLPEARALIAITWLAEGNFEKAIEVLAEPAAKQYLASFQPIETGLETLDVEPGSTALLPRGLITTQRPEFVFVAGPAGELKVEQTSLDGTPIAARRRPLQVAEPPLTGAVTSLAYPTNWALLEAGVHVWTAPGGEPNSASVTVMSRKQRQEIQRHTWQRLSHDIPLSARMFLRGHYYLRSGLYVQAGNQFRDLVRMFPDEPYPLAMLERISAALGVDPEAFLR